MLTGSIMSVCACVQMTSLSHPSGSRSFWVWCPHSIKPVLIWSDLSQGWTVLASVLSIFPVKRKFGVRSADINTPTHKCTVIAVIEVFCSLSNVNK